MLPQDLQPDKFFRYPPEARKLAADHIEALRRLPLAFAPLVLRELIVYDWKFPAERRDLERQFTYLASLDKAQFDALMAPFAGLRLPPSLESIDWVNSPGIFSEQLTSQLWATRQIDTFSSAAVDYVAKVAAFAPDPPLPTHRLAIVIIGRGAEKPADYALFRKIRRQGVYFPNVRAEDGVRGVLHVLDRRAQEQRQRFAHWYIDGGGALPVESEIVTKVSYDALTPARAALQARMKKTYDSGLGPEVFRTQLALMKPEEIGLNFGNDAVLNRFQLSLLTEGSGTQVFATTFVQWAAREGLRRAQPLTIVVRFAPRQREGSMNELLTEAQRKADLDFRGSLIDADMGAWYTYLNHQRLSGAEHANFAVWFEGHNELVAAGPKLEKGRQSSAPVELADLLDRLA